jgi:lipid A 3-O-deacylase
MPTSPGATTSALDRSRRLFSEARGHDGALRHANPRRSELGSRFLFHVGMEAGWRVRGNEDISIVWEHLSNGTFAKPNQGLDRFGIRLGWRFE